MSGCYSIYNLHIFFSNTFETARYNMIIHLSNILKLVFMFFFPGLHLGEYSDEAGNEDFHLPPIHENSESTSSRETSPSAREK